MTYKANILVVDDEESMRRVLSVILGREGYQVALAANATEALRLIKQTTYQLVICDIRMSGHDGFWVLKEVKKESPETKVILMTAFGTVDTAIEAIREGASDYFSKPLKANEILLRVEKVLQESLREKEIDKLRQEIKKQYRFHDIVGKSPVMLDIYDKIKRFANYKTTVLITGESGTGKELIARALHSSGSRVDRPFVDINCGALPSELLESELFGHEKGAFTGAERMKKGLFEEANGGTLFLDEIAEIPPQSQVKLLRALQEEEIRRVGGNDNIKVDVRVIAATEHDLSERVNQGKFRESLFYRLNVVQIHVPPLRARKEDIPLLAKHFVEKYCLINNRQVQEISKSAIEKLLNYNWKGNVRELENAMERSVIMADEGTITADHLPDFFTASSGSISIEIPDNIINMKDAMKEVTETVESTLIRRALKRLNNNRTRAAELLGISQRSLLYKMRDYEIE